MKLYVSLRGCAETEHGGIELVFLISFLLIRALQGSVLSSFTRRSDESPAIIDSQVSDHSVHGV
jgi:hypothetical protein